MAITDNIFWLGHDTFRLLGSRNIYIDPFEIQNQPKADIILITHEHSDHCDPASVKLLSCPGTHVVTEAAAAARLKKNGLAAPLTVVEPGDEIEVDGVNIKIVPSYNLNKSFHPKEKKYLGFIVTLDGLSVYHAGDSDFIPEMADIKAQVALLPVSGTYTMTAEEAAQAALAINPEVAIPMHYGHVCGDLAMAQKFAAELSGKVKVEIKSA